MSLFIGKTERVYSTSDSFQKERVQEILNENHIEYKIRAGMIQDEIRLIRPDLEAWEITGFWLHIPFMWIKRMQSGQ